MQALIPSPHLAARDAKSPDSSSTAAQLSNSKAAKVESAIDYIRTLKQECSEKDRLLDQKDREMEALRKELAALRRSSSAPSSTNAAEADVKMTTEVDSSTSPSVENAT
jgi:cell shape-determining protein MreC